MVTRELLGQFVYCLFQLLLNFMSQYISFSDMCSLVERTQELKGMHHVNKDNIITLDIVMKHEHT